MDERRKQYRSEAAGVVAHLVMGEAVRVELLDLSAGGAGLRLPLDEHVAVGDEVVLRITNPGFTVHLDGEIVSKDGDRVGLEFFDAVEPDLVLPAKAYEMLNRRRSKRVEPPETIHSLLRARAVDESMMEARIVNLSAHGVRLELLGEAPYTEGEVTHLSMELGPEVPLDLVAKVVRVEQAGECTYVSLEFDTIETPGFAEQCREIERYVRRVGGPDR